MPLYAIDPLHPSCLRCELCGQTVAPLPDEGEAPDGELTAEEVCHLWPGLARAVLEHDRLCQESAGVRVRIAD
jgi:hypothetical protein